MNYTAFTALIITFHDASTILSLILAILLSAVVYAIFIRKWKHRLLAVTITFVIALILGGALSEELFQRSPMNVEVVQAG